MRQSIAGFSCSVKFFVIKQTVPFDGIQYVELIIEKFLRHRSVFVLSTRVSVCMRFVFLKFYTAELTVFVLKNAI